jgi:hypothetical protein
MTIDIYFNDSGREPTGEPDPAFSKGRDINLADNVIQKVCCRNLPKAPRCGSYSIVCRTCGFSAMITVAGRPDDPRTITLPCRETRQ